MSIIILGRREKWNGNLRSITLSVKNFVSSFGKRKEPWIVTSMFWYTELVTWFCPLGLPTGTPSSPFRHVVPSNAFAQAGACNVFIPLVKLSSSILWSHLHSSSSGVPSLHSPPPPNFCRLLWHSSVSNLATEEALVIDYSSDEILSELDTKRNLLGHSRQGN